ncbi:hypothetical protein JCM14469_31330 [Desulfatiferula olefinivorans]
MKKFKIAFFVLLVAALGIIIRGNWPFFSTQHPLTINLIYYSYTLPAVANGLFLLGCFLVGFLLAWFSGMFSRFQADKTIKGLRAAAKSQTDSIAALKKEVEFLKRNTGRPAEPSRPHTPLPDENTAVVEG